MDERYLSFLSDPLVTNFMPSDSSESSESDSSDDLDFEEWIEISKNMIDSDSDESVASIPDDCHTLTPPKQNSTRQQASKKDLTIHKETTEAQEIHNDTFECDFCGRHIKRKDNLLIHVHIKHLLKKLRK